MRQPKQFRPLSLSIFWLVLGIILVACNLLRLIEDFWFSMGCAFMIVGILQILRHIRCKNNAAYKESQEIAMQDERNKFLSTKAWAWAGYLYILLGGTGTILFKILGHDDLMYFCSVSVCLIMVLYWLCWLYLRKKY